MIAVLDAAMCLIEILMFYKWMSRNFSKEDIRPDKRKIIVLVTCILCMIPYFLRWSTILKVSVNAFILILASSIYIRGNRGYIVFYTCLFILLVISCDKVCLNFFKGMITTNEIIDIRRTPYQYMIGLVSKLFCLACIYSVGEYSKVDKAHYIVGKRFMVLIMMSISLGILYILSIMSNGEMISSSGKNIGIYFCVIALGLILLNMFSFKLIKVSDESIQRGNKYKEERDKIKVLNHTILDNALFEKEWRKIKHDYSNHLGCIDMLLQMGNIPKARAYISSLIESWQACSYTIYTGNDVADAVFNQKLVKASEHQIELKVDGSIERSIIVDDIDLCAILSNSIDNAIEATDKVQESKDKVIWIKLEEHENKFIYLIKNPIVEAIKEKGQLKTTKKDKKHHGIGMMSIETTAHKYGGEMQWWCDNQWFNLKILLPLE